MVLYLFHSFLMDDIVALTPTPVADHLPHVAKKDAWRLGKQVANDEPLPTPVPWDIIVEQASRYGYCLVQGTQNGDFRPSSQPQQKAALSKQCCFFWQPLFHCHREEAKRDDAAGEEGEAADRR